MNKNNQILAAVRRMAAGTSGPLGIPDSPLGMPEKHWVKSQAELNAAIAENLKNRSIYTDYGYVSKDWHKAHGGGVGSGGGSREAAVEDQPVVLPQTVGPATVKKKPARRRVVAAAQAIPEEPSTGQVDTRTPNELQSRRSELEDLFREHEGQMDSPERQSLWPELAHINARLGNKQEAATAWLNAMWHHESPPNELVHGWAASEIPQTGGRIGPNDVDNLLAAQAVSPDATRALIAGVMAETQSGQAPGWLSQRLPAIQRHIEANEGSIPIRAAWLAAHRLSQLAGGDPLGMARVRDRVLRRIHAGGTAASDLPQFLRRSGDKSTNESLRSFGDRTGELYQAMTNFAKSTPQSQPYIDLMFGHATAKAGDTNRATQFADQARQKLAANKSTPSGDIAHAMLAKLFSHRIQQEMSAAPAGQRFPDSLMSELNAIEQRAKRGSNDPHSLAHYVVTRMRDASKILEPQEKIDPYTRFTASNDQLSRDLAAVRATTDPQQLGKGLANLLQTHSARLATALPHALSAAPLTNPETADRVLRAVPSALQGADPKQQGEILSRAMATAAHFDRRDVVDSLVNQFSRLISSSTGDKQLDLINSASGDYLRGMKKFGMDSEIGRLFDGIQTAIGASKPTTPDAQAKLLQARLGVAGAQLHFNRSDQATPTLDAARSELLSPKMNLPTNNYVNLARSYVRALGSAQPGSKIARILDLFQKMPANKVTDSFTTSPYFSRNHLGLIEDALHAIVGQSDIGDQKWPDEDEYLIRRRIHSDTKSLGQESQEYRPYRRRGGKPTRFAATIRLSPGVPDKHVTGESMITHPYHDENGTHLGNVSVIPRNEGKHLYIAWMGPKNVPLREGENNLGHATVRELMRQLAPHYPDAEFVSGLRANALQGGKQRRVVRAIPGRGGKPGKLKRKPVRYMATKEALERAISADPEEATGYGVMADFLDENGLPGGAIYRAHMDRLQRGIPPKIHEGFRMHLRSPNPIGSAFQIYTRNRQFRHSPVEPVILLHKTGGLDSPLLRVGVNPENVDQIANDVHNLGYSSTAATLRRHVAAQYPKQMSRRQLPRRMAKVDSHQPAHPLVAGFPLEHFLRHLANDPNNTSSVRDLAKVAVTGGPKGDATSGALWALHDALQESDHPLQGSYNLMSAADKVHLDAHTYRALEEEAQATRMASRDGPEYHGRWEFTPEWHAVLAGHGMRRDRQAAPPQIRAARVALVNRVRARVSQLSPMASRKDIDESLKRHQHRAYHVWNIRSGLQTAGYEERALSGPPGKKEQRNWGELAKQELASRYRRPLRFALNARGDFIDSLRRIRSSNQQAMRDTAQAVAQKLGLHPITTLDALHDTPHGSTPGLAQAVYGFHKPEDVHQAAAWYALTSNAPGVAVFHPRPMGPDALYRFRQAGSGLDIRAKMDRHGLTNRIIIPHEHGFDILIPDKGRRMLNAVRGYAKTHGVKLQLSPGHFQAIGTQDRAKARDTFRNKIVQSERMQRRPRRYALMIDEDTMKRNQETLTAKRQRIVAAAQRRLVNRVNTMPVEEAASRLVDAIKQHGPLHKRAIYRKTRLIGPALDKAAQHAGLVTEQKPAHPNGGGPLTTWFSLPGRK